MQKIVTCLFYDGKAQDAVDFYKSVFKNLKINQTSHYGDHGPMPKGSVMTVIFEIEGQKFIARIRTEGAIHDRHQLQLAARG